MSATLFDNVCIVIFINIFASNIIIIIIYHYYEKATSVSIVQQSPSVTNGVLIISQRDDQSGINCLLNSMQRRGMTNTFVANIIIISHLIIIIVIIIRISSLH